MNFEPTHEQVLLRDSVKDVCNALPEQRDQGALVEAWKTFAELGWLLAGTPVDLGGLGGAGDDQAIIASELGAGLATEPYIACGVLAPRILAALAPRSNLATSLLTAVQTGERVAVFVGDMSVCRAAISARREDHGFRLTGIVPTVMGGAIADLLLVAAKLDDGVGELHLFALPKSHAGLAIQDVPILDGSVASEVKFEGALVDVDALLASGGVARRAIDGGIERACIIAAADLTGAAEAALWQTRDYLKTRKQFGTELASFQALQHRMADMHIAVQLAHSIVQYGIQALESDSIQVHAKAASECLIQTSKRARFVTAQAIQLHGGIGVTEELPIGRYFRRVSTVSGVFGSIDSHFARLGKMLEADRELVL